MKSWSAIIFVEAALLLVAFLLGISAYRLFRQGSLKLAYSTISRERSPTNYLLASIFLPVGSLALLCEAIWVLVKGITK
jgi:hypothetical protein